METNIEAIMMECWLTAEDKGWHNLSEEKQAVIDDVLRLVSTEHAITTIADTLHAALKRSLAEEIALAHSELSEALEEDRMRKPLIYHEGIDADEQELESVKPEGVAVEIADLLIRIFDTCVQRKIPLLEALHWKMAYNKTRPYRHGGKKL